MMIELFLFFVVAILTYISYKILNFDYSYFKRRNLKYKSLTTSLWELFSLTFNRFTIIEFVKNINKDMADEPIFGVLDPANIKYVVQDPEIVKNITIKDFDSFENHTNVLNEDIEIFANSLFLMKGQRWRQMRSTLSPAFTGNKMRQMYEFVSETAENAVKHFEKQVSAGKKVNVEMKDFFTRYTSDVIATCAFGLKVDSLAEPENQFYLDGKKITNFRGPLTMLKVLLLTLLPKVARLLKIQMINPLGFKDTILDTMKYREKNNISRPDMINIMIQVREGRLEYQAEDKSDESQEGFATVQESDVGKSLVRRVWTDDELVAQCFLFFFAGFDVTSTLLTLSAYELVVNQDIQQKLYEEIVEMNRQLENAKLNYETLQKMKYLDQFITEVLRKWPPTPLLDRLCNKDYTFDDGNKMKFDIEKKSVIQIHVYSIHHNPKYYPNPEKFDPERFNDENKKNIVPGSFLPFGIGPRNCIGSRFALMETKAILYYLLLNFLFEANDKTDIPLKLAKVPGWRMMNGMNLELKPRSK